MSQIRIEDLPDIGSNFDPLTDYVIVQKSGGDTYKMLLGDVLSGATSASFKYVDRAEFNLAFQARSGSRFTFQKAGLFNYSSSFTLEVTFGTMKTSFVKQSNSSRINDADGLIPSITRSQKIMSDDKYIVYADVEYNDTMHKIVFSNVRLQLASSNLWIGLPLIASASQIYFTASIKADILA